MCNIYIVTACIFIVIPSFTEASTITAVCKQVKGIRIDDVGEHFKIERDEIRDAIWTYTGNNNTNEGTMILQNSKLLGGKPLAESVYATRMASKHWTFISQLGDAVWVHSLYPESGKLLVTQNTSGFSGGLSGKMMTGLCQISVSP